MVAKNLVHFAEYKLYWTIKSHRAMFNGKFEMSFAVKFVDTSNSATIKYYCTNDSFLSVASPDSAATAPISSGC